MKARTPPKAAKPRAARKVCLGCRATLVVVGGVQVAQHEPDCPWRVDLDSRYP